MTAGAALTLYCDFFSGSFAGSVAPEELPLALPEAEPLAPPEAEPELDFEGSLAGSLAPDELEDDDGELGVVAELPLEGEVVEDELEPELDGGGVDEDGEEELLEPLVPLLDLPPPLSWPQAARPKAMATASARVESFMCPPWLGIRNKAAKNGPGPNPLGSEGQCPARCRHFLLRGTSYLLPGAVDFFVESGEVLPLLPGALLVLPLEPDGLDAVPLEPPEAPPPAP